jgi:microcin C transport system substrate-binding protein
MLRLFLLASTGLLLAGCGRPAAPQPPEPAPSQQDIRAPGVATPSVQTGSSWFDTPDSIASPDAVAGGELRYFVGQAPKSFNYFLDTSYSTAQIFGLLYDTLLDTDPITLAYRPGTAAAWERADDQLTFTFTINPAARWSDGQPITAADVAWTFNTIVESPMTGAHKVHLRRFETPEVVDAQTIRFRAKKVHWKNLGALAELRILPKHTFGDVDFHKVNFEFPVVSGPYARGELRDGIHVVLERRADWWRRPHKRYAGRFNFARIKFRFYAERKNAYIDFSKGLLALFTVYTSSRWVKDTSGEAFDRHWVVKQRVYNANPVGFQGFAMNMRRSRFADVRVRRALALLVDREKMNRERMYNVYFLHRLLRGSVQR